MYNRNSKFTSLSILILSSIALSACGSNGVSADGAGSLPQNNALSTPAPTPIGFNADDSVDFSVYGATPSHVFAPVGTDNILNIRLTPLAASVNTGFQDTYTGYTYSGFTAHYGCISYKIEAQVQDVASGVWTTKSTKITPVMTVSGFSQYDCTQASLGGYTGPVATEYFASFNSILTPGHGPVRIRVTAQQTNARCILFRMYGYNYECPIASIYQYHAANGLLEMQVNNPYN